MNIRPKLLLSIALMFSAIITKSTFAEDAKPLNEAFVSAVHKCKLKEMQELIKSGADVNAPIRTWFFDDDWDRDIEVSPLEFAIRHDEPEMVRMLLQVKNKLNTTLSQALDSAIKGGHSAAVEELVKGGADINYVDKDKNTPLILAISHARPISEFSRQAHRQAKSRWKSRKAIIQILLNAGANINHVNKYGKTALMIAIENYDLDTVQALLKLPEITKGSFLGFGKKPINHANEDGNTALIIAINHIRTSYIDGDSEGYHECLNSQNIVAALFKTPGIDVYHANKNGETAISLLEKIKSSLPSWTNYR